MRTFGNVLRLKNQFCKVSGFIDPMWQLLLFIFTVYCVLLFHKWCVCVCMDPQLDCKVFEVVNCGLLFFLILYSFCIVLSI